MLVGYVITLPLNTKYMRNELKKLMKRNDVSELWLANEADVSLMSIWRWKNQKSQPGGKKLVSLAKALKCEIGDILKIK